MKVTKEQIKSLGPCSSGWNKYCEKERTEDLEQLLLEANEDNPANARWLFTKLMTKNQCIEIAIYSAREVLDIFEKKYPKDERPRKAIEAAEKYLTNPTKENRAYAAYAAYAAYDADAAYAAYAAYAADAAYASYAAAYAAGSYAADAAGSYADDAAAYAADAAYAARKEVQVKIILEAVRVLDRGENNE